MKPRPFGFISEEHIDHDGEPFDYIRELHDYLWRFVHTVNPRAGGSIESFVDDAIERAEANVNVNKALLEACKAALVPAGDTPEQIEAQLRAAIKLAEGNNERV